MEHRYLRIGELAEMYDVTTHALRFYEKRGLLSPTCVSDKGYRLYGFDAMTSLEEILLLRSLEFSIETMQTYLHKKDVSEYTRQLEDIDVQVARRIEALKRTQDRIEASREMTRDYVANKDKLYIRSYRERHLLQIKELPDLLDNSLYERDFYQSLKNTDAFRFRASKDMVVLSTFAMAHLCLLVNKEDLKSLQNQATFVLPEGRYLCGFHHADEEDEYEGFLQRVGAYLDKEKLVSHDYGIDILSSDLSVFADQNITHFQTPLVD